MDLIQQHTSSGYTLEIYRDDYPENPREWDNLGVLYIPRPPRGYSLSDEDASLEAYNAAPVKIPIYILDHSGIAISCTPFGDPWDSWHAGFIYMPEDAYTRYFKDREKAVKCLQREIETLDDYNQGDTYCYLIKNHAGEELDSCAGYYGKLGLDCIKEIFREFLERREIEDYPLFHHANIKIA